MACEDTVRSCKGEVDAWSNRGAKTSRVENHVRVQGPSNGGVAAAWLAVSEEPATGVGVSDAAGARANSAREEGVQVLTLRLRLRL